MKRRICRGSFRLPFPEDVALRLFTAKGERAWAEGWDPIFPNGEPSDDTKPGTVFVTIADGRPTTWVVGERRPHGFCYTRVCEGWTAGTVTVSCGADGAATEVEVGYDLTPLSEEGERYLASFEENYDEYLRSWVDAILTVHASAPQDPAPPSSDQASL